MDGASEGRAHVIESARKRQPELKSATTRRGWKAALACVLAGGVFCVAARAQPQPAGQSQPLPAESGSLAVSMEPSVDVRTAAATVHVDASGFVEADPVNGAIFGAGCASNALDVNRAVQSATAASLRAIQVINKVSGAEV